MLTQNADMKRLTLFYITVSATLINSALGQTSGFTYQGRLSYGDQPVTGFYSLSFALFGQPAGGAMVGGVLEKHVVGVTNGLFAVDLDFGTTGFDGSSRWLEIGVKPAGQAGDYQVLSPRQSLTAVPYAIRAAAASAYNGVVADVQLSGNVALKNTSQTFTGKTSFADAQGTFVGTFIGNGAGLTNMSVAGSGGAGGILTGRINQLPNNDLAPTYATVTGFSDAAANESFVTTLFANQTATARNLSVKVLGTVGTGNSVTFGLRVNGENSALECTLDGAATAGNSGNTTVTIPPGAELSISIRAAGTPNVSSALFGWSYE